MAKQKRVSLFFSDDWTRLEKEVLGHRVRFFRKGENIAKITITPSRLPFLKKNWLGGFWCPGTGVGFYSPDPKEAGTFYKEIRRHMSGVIQGISNVEVKGVSSPSLTRIVDISRKDPTTSFTRKRRNSIRQGIKRGVVVRTVDEPEKAADIIFGIKARYEYWGRDKNEVLKVLEYGLKKKLMKLFVSYVDEKPVAEALFLLWNRRMNYSISGFLRDHSWYQPTDVLIWEAMSWGRKHGFREMDMMGGAAQGVGGINRFKGGFGGQIEKRYFLKEVKLGPLSYRFHQS
ncbi:GNAT family N-acetyltransferase [Candidatus Bathyarchaeota archaeon]|nr:GNAT family N-acetyltransferase [Candidatus Bathyarchaeota archaeon]